MAHFYNAHEHVPRVFVPFSRNHWNRRDKRERWNLSAFTIILHWRRKCKRYIFRAENEGERDDDDDDDDVPIQASLTGISAPFYI